MAGEAFGFGETHGLRTESLHGCRRVFLHGDELHEVVDAEAAAHAGHAAGGQGVIGAGDVISHGLRGPAADEDGAGVRDPVEVGDGVDGEMLGGEAVGDAARFVGA